MAAKILSTLRFLIAAVVGYAAIVVGTTLTFEVWLGGIGWSKSSPGVLALATAGALVSGLAGGYLAAWIGGRRPVLHALGVLGFLIIDTTYVITSGISVDPVWFDLAAGGGLMAATAVGGFLHKWVRGRDTRPDRDARTAGKPTISSHLP